MAALLLTWLHRPEQFREVAEVEQALAQRSKAFLIALIKMLLHRPELEALLEMLLEMPPRVDEPKIRQQIVKALFEIYRFDVEFGGVG